jgi:hypothetical protein
MPTTLYAFGGALGFSMLSGLIIVEFGVENVISLIIDSPTYKTSSVSHLSPYGCTNQDNRISLFMSVHTACLRLERNWYGIDRIVFCPHILEVTEYVIKQQWYKAEFRDTPSSQLTRRH